MPETFSLIFERERPAFVLIYPSFFFGGALFIVDQNEEADTIPGNFENGHFNRVKQFLLPCFTFHVVLH